MRLLILIFFLTGVLISGQKLLTPFERGNGNQSTTYDGLRAFYEELDKKHTTISVNTFGSTDSGEPLQLIIYNPDKKFEPKNFHSKTVLLINNGIHPGEPDGIDASMMMLRDFAEGRIAAPKNVVIAVIPCYNIGGMLNRGSFSRANQNGPEEYGFRGNAKNYDLNRDFIKADSRNAVSFQEIFQYLQPDYFIDNHVSNGADYQYTLTYITTNKDRLGSILGDYQKNVLAESVKNDLLKKGIKSVPYVEIDGLKPESGYEAFMDAPRYATGYTSLFNTMGEVMETHMLKNYQDRVEVTLQNMLSTLNFLDANAQQIKRKKAENAAHFLPGKDYTLNWKIDSSKFQMMDFHGYQAGRKPSEVSGKPRLYYDRTKPYTLKIPFYDTYKAVHQVKIPKFYVIPQSEWKILEHLKRNRIKMKPIKSDSSFVAEVYRIVDYKTVSKPYEGHYLHYNTKVTLSSQEIKVRKGDFLVSLNQDGAKYLLETLESEAVDSFFNWNFFDSILGQKEYFSDYVFEDTASDLLKKDPDLRKKLDAEKFKSKDFAEDGVAQLDFIYRNSPYFEKSYQRYPIFRIP